MIIHSTGSAHCSCTIRSWKTVWNLNNRLTLLQYT